MNELNFDVVWCRIIFVEFFCWYDFVILILICFWYDSCFFYCFVNLFFIFDLFYKKNNIFLIFVFFIKIVVILFLLIYLFCNYVDIFSLIYLMRVCKGIC